MYGHSYYGGYHHPGLMGVLGGVIGLTTATLHGGVRVVRTVVEGTLWGPCYYYCDRCYYPYHTCCPPVYHCYHIECRPRFYCC